MKIQPQILGYFILPHDNSDGFASLSLEDLIESNANELKFPFLNNDRLAKCRKGIQRTTINAVDITAAFHNNGGWSPTGRFLYQMSKSGMYDKLGIPPNRLIITTCRKIMVDIIKFGRSNNSRNFALRTKLKDRKYGKELLISQVKQEHVQYNSTTSHNNKGYFGIKFGLYLTNGNSKPTIYGYLKYDTKSSKKNATLFSIHLLQIDDVCYIYEAEIDAIQCIRDDKNENNVFLLFEIKTSSNRDQIQAIFKTYAECSKIKADSYDQIESSLDELKAVFRRPKFVSHFRQGELGNVHKFIYGFHPAQNHSALSCIRVEEFDCYPGTILISDATYLLDFVQLLNETGILSTNYGLTWDNWGSWKLTKDANSVKLWRDAEIIGNLSNRKKV